MEEKKKKVEKKVVKKKVEKTAVPNDEPFSIKAKRFVGSYKFLYTAFGVLLLLVVILSCLVFTKKNEIDKTKSNIVFSILETNTNNYLDLELEGLVGKEYTLKVTNYRKREVNDKEIHYAITVTNDTDVEIEVVKDDSKENLITDQKYSVIEGDLGKKEKEDTIYTFRVTNSDKLKKGDKIRIEVES